MSFYQTQDFRCKGECLRVLDGLMLLDFNVNPHSRSLNFRNLVEHTNKIDQTFYK